MNKSLKFITLCALLGCSFAAEAIKNRLVQAGPRELTNLATVSAGQA